MSRSLASWTSFVVALFGCAAPHHPLPISATAPAAVGAGRGAPRGELPWAELSAETFARAKAERRFIVLDGSAEWCHWCHVMEAETYHDPRVRALLEQRFIAVKVDVDSRPDIEERYGDYGWPATVIFSPDGEELGKYKGFIEADRFLELLRGVASGELVAEAQAVAVDREPARDPSRAPSDELLAWAAHAAAVELEDYWDGQQGGWGRRQKAPIGANNLWLLRRASRGDALARQRALFTLDKQSALLDPVWGGIYQYSEGGTWARPHYEKLMSYQAPALESYARAYQLTGDPIQLARARAMVGYLERFLRNARGTYATAQDADLHAHEPDKPFLRGADYYAKGERERLALGVPRVDPHEYAEDTGLAISALATFYEATRDRAALASAERAAEQILASHADPRGGVTHEAYRADRATPPMRFLSDNVALGMGMARLAEVSGSRRAADAALGMARFLVAELSDPRSGGLFAHTTDPSAVGVFAVRRLPVEDNARALRLLLRLRALRPELAAELAPPIARLTWFVMRPAYVKASGRFLGELLLAFDELADLRGESPAASARQ